MKSIYQKRDRIVLILALTGCIFVCAALAREGIHTAMQRPNALSEAKGEAIETNLPVRVSHPALEDDFQAVHKAAGRERRAHDKQSGAKATDEGKSLAETGRTAKAEDEAKTENKVKEKISLPKGDIVRGFGWQEDGGVWRYHTGIDIMLKGAREVCAATGGTVRRIEKRAGGYLVQVDAGGTLWQYEPLDEVTVSVGAVICLGEMIGRTAIDADRLHIACRRGGEWTDPQTAGR